MYGANKIKEQWANVLDQNETEQKKKEETNEQWKETRNETRMNGLSNKLDVCNVCVCITIRCAIFI